MTMRVEDIKPKHFLWALNGSVATVTLNRPERMNPLTMDSYRELTDTFYALEDIREVRSIVITGAGDNFCSGGDLHDIVGRLVEMQRRNATDEIRAFTNMSGDLVKAMRSCPQPIVAAVDGVCAGAGAIMAMASDFRIGTSRSRVAFLFVRVGLSGADMGACAILPRLIGMGRAAELLYTGRFMPADEAERWGFYTKVVAPDALMTEATAVAQMLASGPVAAHAITKRALHDEWSRSVEDAIDYEARVQAKCMETKDFARAYEAFVAKRTPVFEGD
jgi:enoyl-CoA hydratase/carnithine racemase